MHMKRIYLTEQVSTAAAAARRLRMRWNVTIMVYEFMEEAHSTSLATKFLEGLAREFVASQLPANSWLPLWRISPAWTVQPILLPLPVLQCFQINAGIRVSGQSASSNPIQERLFTLALPSLIAFADATATIRHTLEVDFSALSSSSERGWLELLERPYSQQDHGRFSQVSLETLGASITKIGGRQKRRTSG